MRGGEKEEGGEGTGPGMIPFYRRIDAHAGKMLGQFRHFLHRPLGGCHMP